MSKTNTGKGIEKIKELEIGKEFRDFGNGNTGYLPIPPDNYTIAEKLNELIKVFNKLNGH